MRESSSMLTNRGEKKQLCPCQCKLSPLFHENKAFTDQTMTDKTVLITAQRVLTGVFKNHKLEHLLKAGVVPGVLEDFHVKRVLNFSSTARTVTTICTCKTWPRLSGSRLQIPTKIGETGSERVAEGQ